MGLIELATHYGEVEYDKYLAIRDYISFDKGLDKDRIISIVGEKKFAKLSHAVDQIESLMKEMQDKNIKYISCIDEIYPEFLLEIPNPCYVLFYKGDIELINQFSIGIIGSRKPTPYGKYVAKYFSTNLAKSGVTIISGFALGIDSESHRGATESNGKTIGVLGTSLDNIYPRSNETYANEIIENGNLLISEFPPGYTTFPHHFVQRNRLISALSKGLIVVEAGEKSGTLTTVDFALEQGKSVFAVPGNINSKNSFGTNRLIKLGAKPITEVEDVLEEFLDFNPPRLLKVEEGNLSEDEKKVFDVLETNGILTNEEIACFTNLNIKYIIGVLSVLELKGIVNDLGDNSYSLK